ncbi:hypothetical protein LRD18_06845 [Halorhodospira halochloris]|uniref:Uncharacterized protein n=1 Tax=Halorhodospira halochloris TaxID=1052 RepID=A0A2Z6EZS2_HALHR|nr:hypothetical protein [Halorhodospira halochloris]MBK1652161.1 hypothetical protein [Halorhodospira halochloris]MCG5530589.1 hypothetical protein [Halorhodospira halochloris]MCG5547829.1 hypothetical protein [Halorhodospira halochloris]BBE11099.1 hypothetical protein HH1059_17080 [Halorhodospira halochloris]
MPRALTVDRLRRENTSFQGSGGVSDCNRELGFRPAFMDTETGHVYASCSRDGCPAPYHRLDGLPEELIRERDDSGRVIAVKTTVVSGFERDGCFYTREQAAEMVIDTNFGD